MARIVPAVLVAFLFASNAFAYRVAAWIAPWDAASLTSLQTNAGVLHESNPVWYSWYTDGTIAKNWNAENPTWRAAMVGTQVLPTIQNVVSGAFSASAVAALLADPVKREAHVASIVQLVTANAFDGIDVDYERVPTTSRADFTAFVNSLAQKLHASGKQLSVTVYAKTSDKQNWNGPGAEDWIAIGTAADWVKIMAYDYHYSTSTAGAITPLDWLDQVATYAESAIPPSKIMMALPWYGYDWVDTAGKTVTFASAMQLAAVNGATVTRDANGEPTFTYGGTHTVFFQDAASYKQKFDALRAKHPNIDGFAHWVAGQEDPQIWSTLKNGYIHYWAPAQPPPPPPFIKRRSA